MKRAFTITVSFGWVMAWLTLAQTGPQKSPGEGAQQQGGQTPSGAQPTQAESQAYQAIQNELDPDQTIRMVNDFEKKFPTSQGMPFAYLRAADAYRQKGDVPHVIEYGEKSLKLKGDNPVALILVASLLPEPQSLQGGNEVDKEKKLAEAEDYANRAIKLVDELPKQAGMSVEQFQKNKSALASWAHSSLGMVHLERSEMGLAGPDLDELGKAEKEYQTAISLSDAPNPGDYFRLGEAYSGHGKVEEAIQAFSKASELDQVGSIKPLADQQIEGLKKKRAAGEKPSPKPPAKP